MALRSLISSRLLLWAAPVGVLGALGACGGDPVVTSSSTGNGGNVAASSSSGDLSGSTTSGGFGGNGQHGPYADFPTEPVVDDPDGTLPADIGGLFGGPDSGTPDGGPCLVEPEIGALIPNNWLRPRFRMNPAADQNVFEIRIHSTGEINDLVVYTANPEWKMEKDMWTLLLGHLQDIPMTVTVRGAKLDGDALAAPPALGSSGDITIAPAAAEGSIVFWHTISDQNTGVLKGFSAGDETVAEVLTTPQIQVQPGGNSVTCIGCHASTPDGKYAAYKTLGGTSGDALSSVEEGMSGESPAFWSAASVNAMNQAALGVPTFSKGHWADGDHVAVTSFGNGADAKLAWFDLEATTADPGTAYGFLDRTGDSHGAIMPTWSHDGSKLVYISTDGSGDGRPTSAPTDLVSVPYGDRAGGAASPIEGAATAEYSEYYPAFSPDDQLLAFNRVTAGGNTYNEPSAEVYVIPTAGGTATRVLANDPPQCSGMVSPGITNSWPKWAPEAVQVGDRTFYWIIFSSRRNPQAVPQLYVSAVVSQGGTLTTYPALYLWNQAPDEANHTPAWDVFKIPPPPPPQ